MECDYKLMPFSFRYLDECVDLVACQLINNVSTHITPSPIYLGLQVSKDQLIKYLHPILMKHINSPVSCLLLDPQSDEIIGGSIMFVDGNTNNYRHGTVRGILCNNYNNDTPNAIKRMINKKDLIDEYLESETSENHDGLCDAIRNSQDIKSASAFGDIGYLFVNSKYYKNYSDFESILQVLLYYNTYLCKRCNVDCVFSIINDKYTFDAVSKFYQLDSDRSCSVVMSKMKYSQLFDFVGIDDSQRQKNVQLVNSMKIHLYRYYCATFLNDPRLDKKLDEFIKTPKHENIVEMFDKNSRISSKL